MGAFEITHTVAVAVDQGGMLEQQIEREQDTVADLRKRLDRAEDRVTALTDQRPKPRSWWPFTR